MGLLNDVFNDGYKQYGGFINQGQRAIGEDTARGENFLYPYRNAGVTGIDDYEHMLDGYMDPTHYMDEIEQHYQISPGAQFRLKYGMNALKGRLAAEGLGGSGAEDTSLANYMQGVIGQDENNYISNVLGVGRTGMEGFGDLAKMGEQGAITSGNYDAQAGEDEASLWSALANAAAKHQQDKRNSIWGAIGSGVGTLLI